MKELRITKNMARAIYRLTGKYIKKIKNDSIITNLKILNPSKSKEELLEQHYTAKINLIITIVFAAIFLSIMTFLSGISDKNIIDGIKIQRNTYGGTTKEIEAEASGEEFKEQLDIEVEAREYSKEEIMKLFKDSEQTIQKQFLGENISPDSITKNLNLFTLFCNDLISVDWCFDIVNIINADGSINEEVINENIGDNKSVLVEVTAKLTYDIYSYDYIFFINVKHPEYTPKEVFVKKIEDIIMSENLTEEFVVLPKKIDGENITWSEKMENTPLIILMLGIFTAATVSFFKDREIEDKMKERKKQMLIDYPEIVSKIILFMSSGMTMYSVWQKIVFDYKEKNRQKGQTRYAYEEMVITLYEIKDGIAEVSAYERFGKRCSVSQYIKLSALITQNLRLGSKGMSEMLRKEAAMAFEDRKSIAKQQGEEAGTKLLVPMMLMLLIVLVIIIVPAFLSFSI